MFVLYHYTLCPFSRLVRILLHEKGIKFSMRLEKFWEHREDFVKKNPIAVEPMLEIGEKSYISTSRAILEYLEELRSYPNTLGNSKMKRAINREMSVWFDTKFYNEVTRYYFDEKIKKLFLSEAPNSKIIRYAKANMKFHIGYIEHLLRSNRYLTGDSVNIVDFTAASQLSVIDFLGEVPWSKSETVKNWYALVKSRPSFRGLLKDKVIGLNPPSYYNNPDF